MADLRFPKRLRLLRASDFERVFAERNSAANDWLVLHGAINDLGYPRLGITVSRRVGNAVQRNRWKRLLREGFRQLQHDLPAMDFVCVARAPEPPPLSSLESLLIKLAARIERRANGGSQRGRIEGT